MRYIDRYRPIRTFALLALAFAGALLASGLRCQARENAWGSFPQVIPVAEAFQEGWLKVEKSPWYIEILPESRFLRLLLFGSITAGIKALFFGSKKSSTTQPTPRQNQSPPPAPPAASVAQSRLWLYQSEGREVGSFDEATLRQLKGAGVISSSTSIRRSDGGNWITYADVFGDN